MNYSALNMDQTRSDDDFDHRAHFEDLTEESPVWTTGLDICVRAFFSLQLPTTGNDINVLDAFTKFGNVIAIANTLLALDQISDHAFKHLIGYANFVLAEKSKCFDGHVFTFSTTVVNAAQLHSVH